MDKKIKVMSVFGTRPEAIKMAPLVKELETRPEIESIVCVTAQHREMLDQVLEIFDLHPKYDLNIMQSRQTLAGITTRALTGLEEVDRVEFTVEGGLLIRYGSLSISEPLVRDERCIGPVRTGLGEQDATAYLCHSSENLLLPIPVRLPQNSTMSSEELLLRALLSDPGTNGIRSLIPAGTAPNFVTTYNGTCHVDLSDEFLSDPGNLPSQRTALSCGFCPAGEVDFRGERRILRFEKRS